MKKQILRLAALSALAVSSSFATPMATVGLQLLIDVSASISAAEYQLQRAGYAAAFLDPTVIANIEAQPDGILVQTVHWAGQAQQKEVIGWTKISNKAEATAFAAKLAVMPRGFVGGLTGVQAALLFGSTQFAAIDAKRLITDISGDGFCNDPGAGKAGFCGTAGKDAMTKLGVRVNGLVIGGDPVVEAYYLSDVVTNGGIVYKAADFKAFESALVAKIRAETSNVPEPSTWALILTGLAGLMISARRRSA
jgi:hypothetical protein